MNKKIPLLLLVLLSGLRVSAIDQADKRTALAIIQTRLGASSYTIRLIDLRPHVAALFNEKGIASTCRALFAQGVYSEITQDGQIHMLRLAVCPYKGGEIFRLSSVVANPALGLFDAQPDDDDHELAGLSLLFGQMDMHTRTCVAEYDVRVQKTLAHMKNINEQKNWFLQLEDVPETTYISSLTKCITHVDGYVQPRIAGHWRANLFDMFSLTVDHYLHYGIGETIIHENKKHPESGKEEHFQISLFGVMSGQDGDGNDYELPGFFQYTFNLDGVCYHRAFKPWTVYHLRSTSNSKTQSILRLAVLSYLNDAKPNPAIEKARQTLLLASNMSKDHKNWMFADSIVTDRCHALSKQIWKHCRASKG